VPTLLLLLLVMQFLSISARTDSLCPRRPHSYTQPVIPSSGRQYFLLKTALTVSSVNELRRLTAALSAARTTKICGEE